MLLTTLGLSKTSTIMLCWDVNEVKSDHMPIRYLDAVGEMIL